MGRRLLPLTALLALLASACVGPSPTSADRHLVAMGTVLRVTAVGTDAQAIAERAVRAVQAADARWSTWQPETPASQLNRTPVRRFIPVDALFLAGWHQARAWAEYTDGAFDPTIGEVVDLWRAGRGISMPAPESIESTRRRCGVSHILVTDTTIARDQACALATGGFAKGLALDDALREARREGAPREIVVELGGQLRFWRRDPGELHVGIAHPDVRSEVFMTLAMGPNSSVATSGNSERPILIDGVRYSHILDPRTGRPAPDWGSVTILAEGDDAGCVADCLSTACYVLGPTAAVRLIESVPAVEVLCLERTPTGVRPHLSSGMGAALRPPHSNDHRTPDLPR